MRRVNRTAHLAGGTTHEAVEGLPFDDTPWWRVEEEWLDKLRGMIAEAAGGETVRADMPWSAADGSRRWVDFQIAPVTNEAGEVTALIPNGVDITERHQNERQQRLMTAELNHRVKNNLAVVRSLATQTFGADDPRVTVFGDRLEALGAAHGLLTRSGWAEAELTDLVETSLALYQGGRRCLVVPSPSVRLAPQPATSYALAFHELCTNAIKHGALSNARGTVRIGWRIEPGGDGGGIGSGNGGNHGNGYGDGNGAANDRDQLEITWSEHDGPDVLPPSQRGFGTRMISRVLASDIRGTVDMDFRPEGLRVTMRAPLAAVAAD